MQIYIVTDLTLISGIIISKVLQLFLRFDVQHDVIQLNMNHLWESRRQQLTYTCINQYHFMNLKENIMEK